MQHPHDLASRARENVDEAAEVARHARRVRRRRHLFPLIGAATALTVLVPLGYAAWSYTQFTGNVTHVDAIPKPAGKKHDDVDGTAQNILLVGDDHRPAGASAEQMRELGTEDDGGSMNTDTMIVLHVSADGRSASMISMPRDSYVDIPGHGKSKLNAAFAWGSQDGGSTGGAKLLISTVEQLTGLTIDHYVRVSLLGFYDIVKALGPVDVCLNQATKDPYSGVDLPAGKSTLNASQALSFVRQRHGLLRGDLDRQVRQQYFLTVEAKRVLSAGTLLNPIKLNEVLTAVSSSIETDDDLDIAQLATQLRHLRPDAIRSATIPVSGTPTITVNGSPLSIVEVDQAAMPAFIESIVGKPEQYQNAKAADPATVHAVVVNGSGTAGAAAAAATALSARGFAMAEPGTAPTTTTQTVVQYPSGAEAAAKALANAVPGAATVESKDVTTVTLVLGTDGKTVAATNQAAASTPAAPQATTKPAVPEATPTAGTRFADVPCIN